MKKLLLTLIFITSGYPQISSYFDFLNIPSDKNVQKFQITATSNNYIIDDSGSLYYFQVTGIVGKNLTIDWGDETVSSIIFTGLDQRIIKTYTNVGTYNVTIKGWKYITGIRWENWELSAFNLKYFPDKLTYLQLNNLGNNITGRIGSLSKNINVISLNNCGNGFDLVSGLRPFNNADISIKPQAGYGYTTAQIDEFLTAYDQIAGMATKTIDLTGANESRSTLSDIAVTSLEAKGRIILVNGIITIEGLFTSDGGELYTSDGARLIAQ